MASPSSERGASGSTWRNWAGDQSCAPFERIRPRGRDELAEAVAAAAAAGRKVGVPGSGHSFTEAALTAGTMLDVGALSGVIDADRSSGLVKVGAGTVLADLNEELSRLGLAMENLGDIDRQTLAGAISTGTHGTGAKLGNISSQVVGDGAGPRRRLGARAGGGRRRPAARGPGRDRRARRDYVGDPALRPRLHPAPGRHAAPARGGLRLLPGARRRATSTSSSSPSPTRTRPWCWSATAPTGRRGRAARSPPTSTTSCSENWALEALSAAGKAMPRANPALSRFAAAARLGEHGDRSQRPHLRQRAPRPLHRDGVRGAARARARGGAAG